MKKLIIVAVLIAILGSMYGYVLGRGVSRSLLEANASQVANLPDISFGVSLWDQIVFWSGPIFVLLLIWPALSLGFELYFRDEEKKAPLELRMITQLKEWLKDLSLRDQQEANEKNKANPANG